MPARCDLGKELAVSRASVTGPGLLGPPFHRSTMWQKFGRGIGKFGRFVLKTVVPWEPVEPRAL